MSGYNRNLTLQEQWSRLCENLFSIEAQEGVPLVSCKTANRLSSMTKLAAYSGSAGRYCLNSNGLRYCYCLTLCLQTLR